MRSLICDTRATSSLRELELDAAVAAIGLLGLVGIDWLEFAEPRRDEPLRRYALADEVLHDRDRARDRKLPVVPELRAVDRPHVGVAIDPQHPGNLARNFLFQFEQRDGETVQLREALRFVEGGPPRVEEHFRLEHETVADDANVGAIAENGAQSSEEVGTVSREFLHPLRERYVQPLAQVGNAALRFLVLFLAGFECRFERAKLAPQRRDLLIEHLDLRQRPGAEPPLRVELTAELGGLALRVAATDPVVEALVAVALAFGRRQARLQHAELLLQAELAGLLQRQKLGELGNLRVEAVERGVFAGDLLGQVKLHEHEHCQQEDDGKDERRKGVDESRPVIHAAVAASACESHWILLELSVRFYLLTFSRTRISSRRRTSRCCWACESTQSRIICCSLRMWWTSPWIASARLAMAVVVARLEPPSVIASRSRSMAMRKSPGTAPDVGAVASPPTPRSRTVVESQSSSSI